MVEYTLSPLAQRDMKKVVRYTLKTWGASQTERYVNSLYDCMELLATSPKMGRACPGIHPNYRRFEHKKHVILYRQTEKGIYVGRILHERMRAEWRVIEDI